MTSDRLIRLADVKAKTGLSKTKIYDLVKANEFPRQVQITNRLVAWSELQIDDWITSHFQSNSKDD